MADAREAPQASKEIPKVTSKGTPTGTPKGTREDDPEKPPKGEPKGTPNDAPEEGTKNTTKDAKQPKNEISSNKTDDIVLPTGWEKWDPDQKLRWLNTQVLPSDPNINLGDCYRRSAKLTRIFRIVMNSVKNLRKAVVKRASATLKKYWNAFALALQNGVGRLSNYIYDNCEALLKNGNFPDGAAPLPPVRLPDLPMIDGDEVPEESPNQKSKTKDGKPEKPLSDTFWGTFCDTLSVLTNSWPWLTTVQPSIKVSYAELLKTVAEAGQIFFQEFKKPQGDDQPSDEGDAFIHQIVDNAVADGIARNLQPGSQGAENAWSPFDSVPAKRIIHEALFKVD